MQLKLCRYSATDSGLDEEQATLVADAVRQQSGADTRATTLWKPSGHITYRDAVTGKDYPVAGVKIMLFGYKSKSEIVQENVTTDFKGNFTATKEYLPGVSASIQWNTSRYAVMSNETNAANTSQAGLSGPWTLTIQQFQNLRNHQFATAYLAADYMQNNGYYLSGSTKICVLDESLPATVDDDIFLDGAKDKTKMLVYSADKSALDIRAAVSHLMGKGQQRIKIGSSTTPYENFSHVVTQSWGEFTESYFVDKFYTEEGYQSSIHTYQYKAEYGGSVAVPDALNEQWWYYVPSSSAHNQCNTPMFIDLYDSFDQYKWPENLKATNIIYPNDKFYSSGLRNFADFELWSRTCKDPTELRNTIIANLTLTRSQLTALTDLFQVYIQLEAAL